MLIMQWIWIYIYIYMNDMRMNIMLVCEQRDRMNTIRMSFLFWEKTHHDNIHPPSLSLKCTSTRKVLTHNPAMAAPLWSAASWLAPPMSSIRSSGPLHSRWSVVRCSLVSCGTASSAPEKIIIIVCEILMWLKITCQVPVKTPRRSLPSACPPAASSASEKNFDYCMWNINVIEDYLPSPLEDSSLIPSICLSAGSAFPAPEKNYNYCMWKIIVREDYLPSPLEDSSSIPSNSLSSGCISCSWKKL